MAKITITRDDGDSPEDIYNIRAEELTDPRRKAVLFQVVEEALREVWAKEVYDNDIRRAFSEEENK